MHARSKHIREAEILQERGFLLSDAGSSTWPRWAVTLPPPLPPHTTHLPRPPPPQQQGDTSLQRIGRACYTFSRCNGYCRESTKVPMPLLPLQNSNKCSVDERDRSPRTTGASHDHFKGMAQPLEAKGLRSPEVHPIPLSGPRPPRKYTPVSLPLSLSLEIWPIEEVRYSAILHRWLYSECI